MRELSIADFRQLTEGEKQSTIHTFSLPPSKIKDFCHLPHQREAGCGGSLKQTDKLEFNYALCTVNYALLMCRFQRTQDAIVIETSIVNFRQEHQPGGNICHTAALCHQGGIGGIDAL